MNRILRIIFITLIAFCLPAQALVKKSNSGICHDEGSRYYQQTKHFTPYQTLEDCLNSGGRLPKGYTSKYPSTYQPVTKLSNQSVDTGYSRDKFGKGWLDEDHDGQDTRQEILIAQNTGNLVYNSKGRVVRGRWVSMYSGKVIINASEVDIDHVVPLSWAWKHGASNWTQEKREQFANDQRNLVAVEASLNRQKGDRGLDECLPPKNTEQYKARFLRILKICSLR
jgi:hypothetical protein